MIRKLTLIGALTAAALPAFAQDAEQKAALVAAIEAAGCRVTAANNADVLTASGVPVEAASAIVQQMIDSGEAVPEGEDLVLKTGGCA